MAKRKPCRHSANSWIVAGGSGEWCYVCGAYRGLAVTPGRWPRTRWVKPTGDRDDNPVQVLTYKVRGGGRGKTKAQAHSK